ncbi:Trihelix transcription factor GT-3a [Hibiscus syriacus]|uniref:Trihelix transcription factor GT-3a n=1 Tax=Hibiscus syriacus TaxID=106335 RepID=A0A6A3BM25_HIBSY|nr:trihelix transcription factor GT-3b-like [Hibiscus syriacus]KAE8717385.1 Trihelix transcription factor GT-3a [Hibiscus syriacus]
MEGHPHHHQLHHHHHYHHQHLQQQYQYHHQQQKQPTRSVSDDGDRFPQWSLQETKEFLMIRAELDRSFLETKRNKLLWEVISTRMREMGYNRSAEQCKCKWKNIFTRYKGCETMEEEAMRQQFPFYNELQSIFLARTQSKMLSEAEGGETGLKRKAVQLSSDEEEDIKEEKELEKSSVRKKKQRKSSGAAGSTSGNNTYSIKEILEDFMKQQTEMEMQWREEFEARENERRSKEMEWREKMEALENERLLMDRRWYEREEQRRIREEARAEKRDALVTALLNKVRREDHHM